MLLLLLLQEETPTAPAHCWWKGQHALATPTRKAPPRRPADDGVWTRTRLRAWVSP
ncbi:hypothetical protein CKAH01_14194 [Colletotrichum kahawae]|uniref:Uncharacterized protein n=1 Tax=Colletotrichum kahawae TaxID=34407 RepID=A0AAD9YMJ8_COLKA|nr:hypothetical protein CKAH01_14194 [Colletotrichum kahawae]